MSCTDLRPALQIHDRITNPSARTSILKLRRAIEQAEHEVPGLMNVLISEIVDSVEVSCSPPSALNLADLFFAEQPEPEDE